MSGNSLFGKDGVFAPVVKNFIDKALESEIWKHLDVDQRPRDKKRSSKGKKTIKIGFGSFDI